MNLNAVRNAESSAKDQLTKYAVLARLYFHFTCRSETAYTYQRLQFMLIQIENLKKCNGFSCWSFLVMYIVKLI